MGIILIAGFLFVYLFFTPKSKSETERFVVSPKASEAEIINQLEAEGYLKGWLRSPTIFKLTLSYFGWHNRIEPGGYKLSKEMYPWTMVNILVEFPYQKWVTLPEGLREEQMAEILQEKLGWKDDKKQQFLLQSKEGYSFPDTYLLNLDQTGYQVAKRLNDRFNEKVADLFKEATKQNIRHDTLIILASLIQREAANEEEMPLIAGIIWNRLLKPMPLQIDATIQYVIGEPGNWWKPVTPEEYKIESPYNTYLHGGKTPAPICNPGLAAIEAVVHDQPSDYFYYLHDADRQIHCAETYPEHLDNIKKYLQPLF